MKFNFNSKNSFNRKCSFYYRLNCSLQVEGLFSTLEIALDYRCWIRCFLCLEFYSMSVCTVCKGFPFMNFTSKVKAATTNKTEDDEILQIFQPFLKWPHFTALLSCPLSSISILVQRFLTNSIWYAMVVPGCTCSSFLRSNTSTLLLPNKDYFDYKCIQA